MKLIEITKSKITKNENGENVPYLKITKVVLIHCSNINNSYQQNCIHLFLINRLVNVRYFTWTFYILKKIDSEIELKYGLLIKILIL